MAKQKEELLIEQDFREISDRQIYPLQVRMSRSQKKRLDQLAKMSGYRTLSQYARSKMLEDPLALDRKLNQVLEMVKKLLEEQQCQMKAR